MRAQYPLPPRLPAAQQSQKKFRKIAERTSVGMLGVLLLSTAFWGIFRLTTEDKPRPPAPPVSPPPEPVVVRDSPPLPPPPAMTFNFRADPTGDIGYRLKTNVNAIDAPRVLADKNGDPVLLISLEKLKSLGDAERQALFDAASRAGTNTFAGEIDRSGQGLNRQFMIATKLLTLSNKAYIYDRISEAGQESRKAGQSKYLMTVHETGSEYGCELGKLCKQDYVEGIDNFPNLANMEFIHHK